MTARGGNNTAVPVGASMVDQTTATSPDGQVVKVQLFEGEASDGYKSSYTARPARWLAWIRRDSDRGPVNYRHVKRYAGRNFDQARRDYAAAAGEVAAFVAEQAQTSGARS